MVVVAPIKSRITCRLVRGWPRQLDVTWNHNRCSILFHFEVPGGKWQTVMATPMSVAKRDSSSFHSRARLLLEGLHDKCAATTLPGSKFERFGAAVQGRSR